ncbi:IucA/IucC family protein [Micromonospora sonneratiae]|uniref:IucA/IucC family protein n=1 Tax=Micromonospora sonneratiae TaxID=1184706 RepID=A0ABW3YBT5_9ACTN
MTDVLEGQVFVRVLDALLREDHLGLDSVGEPAGDGWWQVRIPAGLLRIPIRPDGFQHTVRVVRPVVYLHPDSGQPYQVDRLESLLALLAPQEDPEAEAGWADLVDECRADLLARRLAEQARPRVYASIAARRAIDPTGMPGALLDEVVAAYAGHPVYPTDRCRHGLDAGQLRAYAPEHAPTFQLRWLPTPRSGTRLPERLPPWWPVPDDPDTVLLPVHPLTAEQAGLPVIDRPAVEVRPTLSMRTVALADDPYTHLKLPLPTATLGVRNRRTLKPDTLADGAIMAGLLDRIAAAEPAFHGRVLHTDESRYGHHDGDELRAFLLRGYPPDLADTVVIPVAALAARDETGVTVAERVTGGDPVPLVESYLDLLLDWHVHLWLRHGIALEAHPQNLHLVVGPGGRLRLLYKDNDGARLDLRHSTLPVRDRRMLVHDPGELADVFTTITLHLAAAAPLLALAGEGVDVPSPAAALRPRLVAARDRWGGDQGRWAGGRDRPGGDQSRWGGGPAAELLTERLLATDRLPVKAMLTAGTLLPKQRLGCTDINKCYRRTGPNYLRVTV